MTNPDIGTIECPACGFPEAAVRESKKGKAYMVCENCGYQGFSRGPESDKAMRRNMTPIKQAEPQQPAAAPIQKPHEEKSHEPSPWCSAD